MLSEVRTEKDRYRVILLICGIPKNCTNEPIYKPGIVTDIEKVSFACTGSINIAGTRIKCWRYYRPHGSESLRQALMNSCNPVFIGLRATNRSRSLL